MLLFDILFNFILQLNGMMTSLNASQASQGFAMLYQAILSAYNDMVADMTIYFAATKTAFGVFTTTVNTCTVPLSVLSSLG